MSKILKRTQVQWSADAMILSLRPPAYIETDDADKRLQEDAEKLFKAGQAEAERILSEAREQAQRIVEDAAQRAEELRRQSLAELEQELQKAREEAQRSAELAREQAKQEGFAEGYEEGKAAAIQEEQDRIRQARDVLESAYARKEQIIAEAEPFLVELAVEIARKIIGDELSSSPDAIAGHARRVLQRSRVHGQITLCVNHRYYQWLEEQRDQLLALLDSQAELQIIPDYAVQDEGCVIRTPFGSFDARIDTQLAEVKQALLEIARGKDDDAHAGD